MEKFIVSARKYRPQLFSSVVGQAHITTTLKNAIRNKQLAHAFLFCGPRGVGKTTCARILAKTINCENLQKDGEACNQCESCVSFNNGSSLNIHELDAASNNSVDDIRTLTEQIRFAPQAGKYKVYIIDEVHMLSASAFNAFLKTLEEPPPYAIFILATTEKHKIIPTILSRCQIFDFKRITMQDTVNHLKEIVEKEKISADVAALQVISQKSEGCMRDALSILDKIVSFSNGKVTYETTLEHLNILDEEYYFKILEFTVNEDLAGSMLLYDDINRKGFESDTFIHGFAEFLRNLMVCKDESTANLLEAVEGFREKYIAKAKTTPLAWLIGALNILGEAEINYKQARNKRLHAEMTLIKLTYLKQAIEWEDSGEGIHKKKRLTQSKPVAFKNLPIVAYQPGEKGATSKSPVSISATPQKSEPVENSGARLVVEENVRKTSPTRNTNNTQEPEPLPRPRQLGALQKIRKQVAESNQTESAKTPMEEASLGQAWNEYIIRLQEEKNHSAVTNFKLSKLKVLDEDSFEIITESNIQQKFIEQERATLIEHLQNFFNNKQISYQVTVEESPDSGIPEERPLSAREQYLKMIEQFPLVKELKDRLNLELDY